MKTYKTLVPCLAMLLFLALACSKSSTSSNTPTPDNSPTTATDPQSEAQKQAEEFWGKYVATCGASSFMRSQEEGKFTELNGVRIVVDFERITEGDRLNGIEVQGSTQIKSSSYRYFYDSEWHQWKTGTPQGMTYDARFRKSNGQWIFEGTNTFKAFAREMTCNDLAPEYPD